MEVTIEDEGTYYGGRDGDFPINLISFRMDPGSPFYDNNDYTYDFREGGESRTLPVPLGFRPTKQELNHQSWVQFKGLLRPKIEQPPKSLKILVEDLFATRLINPHGDMGGVVWPISFTSKWELHVIKQTHVSIHKIEPKLLRCIAVHFHVSEDSLNAHHVG